MIATDSRALVEIISSNRISQDCQIEGLLEDIDNLSKNKHVIIQWIPSHINVDGNDKADELANKGSKENQNQIPLPYQSIKSAITRKRKHINHLDERAAAIYKEGVHQDKKATRKEAVILAQLRSVTSSTIGKELGLRRTTLVAIVEKASMRKTIF